MTVQSLTPAQRRSSALRSTVALKAAMAISGLVMALFLLVHMDGNLKVFSGRAAFIVYHLLHLTTNTGIHPGALPSPHVQLVAGFQVWWVVVSYTIALIAVGLHLRHGFWSAFATLSKGFPPQVRRKQ